MGNGQAKIAEQVLETIKADDLPKLMNLAEEHKNDINFDFQFQENEHKYEHKGWTVVHHAAELQRTGIIRWLGQQQHAARATSHVTPNFYLPSADGETPLCVLLSARGVKLDCLKAFLDVECRLDSKAIKISPSASGETSEDYSALHLTVLNSGANPDAVNIIRYLIQVAKTKLYAGGNDEEGFKNDFINARDVRGQTPLDLVWALQNPPIEIAKVLIEEGGALIISQEDASRNILREAAITGTKEVFDFLVSQIIKEKGDEYLKERLVEDSHSSKDGQNPLLEAAYWKNKDVVEFLVTDPRCKSDVSYRRKKDGKGALDLAKQDLTVGGMLFPDIMARKKATVAYLESLSS